MWIPVRREFGDLYRLPLYRVPVLGREPGSGTYRYTVRLGRSPAIDHVTAGVIRRSDGATDAHAVFYSLPVFLSMKENSWLELTFLYRTQIPLSFNQVGRLMNLETGFSTMYALDVIRLETVAVAVVVHRTIERRSPPSFVLHHTG